MKGNCRKISVALNDPLGQNVMTPDYDSYLVDSSIGVHSWIPCIILRCAGSINRERRDRSMKKLSEYVQER
jgi:hypothetical protein